MIIIYDKVSGEIISSHSGNLQTVENTYGERYLSVWDSMQIEDNAELIRSMHLLKVNVNSKKLELKVNSILNNQ